MVCGLVAGLLAFAFATIYAEPQIGHALVFEAQMQKADGVVADPEVYSRAVQSTVGLLTAVAAIAVADGGLFGLAFAVAYGRCGVVRPRVLGLLVAAAAFVTTVIVPAMKYPANPASPHGGETIASVSERVASWLVLLSAESGAWIAFTHHEVVRVAVLDVLGAPLAAFARVDVGPGAFVDVTWHRGQYRLRL